MSCACGCGGPPCFTRMSQGDLSNSLGQKLIGVADNIRDLRVRFGLRPYRVRILRTRWAGAAKRGVGPQIVSWEMEILPVPKISDLTGLTEIINPVGADEVGSIMLTEISGRYTEDVLRGFDQNGAQPEPNEQVFYEVEFSTTGERRRFYFRSAPTYLPSKFQWQIRLERSHEERTRDGALQG